MQAPARPCPLRQSPPNLKWDQPSLACHLTDTKTLQSGWTYLQCWAHNCTSGCPELGLKYKLMIHGSRTCRACVDKRYGQRHLCRKQTYIIYICKQYVQLACGILRSYARVQCKIGSRQAGTTTGWLLVQHLWIGLQEDVSTTQKCGIVTNHIQGGGQLDFPSVNIDFLLEQSLCIDWALPPTKADDGECSDLRSSVTGGTEGHCQGPVLPNLSWDGSP